MSLLDRFWVTLGWLDLFGTYGLPHFGDGLIILGHILGQYGMARSLWDMICVSLGCWSHRDVRSGWAQQGVFAYMFVCTSSYIVLVSEMIWAKSIVIV